LILASHPLAVTIAAPYFGLRINSVGQKNTLIIAMACCIVSTLLAGGASFFDSPKVFLTISIVSRLLSGLSAAATYNVIYAVISVKYTAK
jgi:MFS family permease